MNSVSSILKFLFNVLSNLQKKFGSPLKNARNSEDIVDRGDQPRETSLAPGQFLVITQEVYGRYGHPLGPTIDGRMLSQSV